MLKWFAPSLISLVSFGLWGFFSKLSIEHIDFKSAFVYQTLGILLIVVLGLFLVDFKPAINMKGFIYALLTGLAYASGCLFYFIAASRGKLITVESLTALYPVITILLSYSLLKEVVSIKQVLGILLAFLAMFLMLD